MPKGKPHKKQTIGREIPKDTEVVPAVPATLEQLNRSMDASVSQQLAHVGKEIRERIIDEAPDIIETLFRLSKGITVQTFDKDGDEVVYTVPPHWGAIKYLTEWARLLLETDPAPAKNRHGLDKETREFLQQFVTPAGRPNLPQMVNGTFVLGTEQNDNADD